MNIRVEHSFKNTTQWDQNNIEQVQNTGTVDWKEVQKAQGTKYDFEKIYGEEIGKAIPQVTANSTAYFS